MYHQLCSILGNTYNRGLRVKSGDCSSGSGHSLFYNGIPLRYDTISEGDPRQSLIPRFVIGKEFVAVTRDGTVRAGTCSTVHFCSA